MAQLTILFGFLAMAGWAAVRLMRAMPLHTAITALRRLLVAPALTLALIVAFVLLAAMPEGMQVGSYAPFRLELWHRALAELARFTLGAPVEAMPVLPIGIATACIAALLLVPSLRPRAPFYLLAIIAFPVTSAVLEIGNSYPRYFLLAGVAMLLLGAELAGLAFVKGGWRRWSAVAALAAVLAGSLMLDLVILRDRRGAPERAVAIIARKAPQGVEVALDSARMEPVVAWAAARAGYRLRTTLSPCSASPFLIADLDRGRRAPRTTLRCGQQYRVLAEGRAKGLSGIDWALYIRLP